MPNSKNKGKRGERYWKDRLNIILPPYRPWYRDLGQQGYQRYGDLVSDVENPYYVECKCYQRVSYGKIIAWWEDAIEKAHDASKAYCLLCIKPDTIPGHVYTNAPVDMGVRRRASVAEVFLVQF